MIRFICQCGTQLQARDEHAGLMVLCPACQRQQKVPQPPPTAVQPVEVVEPVPARASARRGPPPIREEPEEEVDRPRRHRQFTAGSSGKATASLVLGIVSLCGCSCLTGLPAILFGILSLLDISQAAGRLAGKGTAIFGIALGSFGTLCVTPSAYFGYVKVQDAKARAISANNLKQMGLAMHNYNGTYGSLPPAVIRDTNGKPLFSWRVALLPFLEQGNVYNSFKRDEPWDSPHNKPLSEIAIKTFQLPGDDKTPANHTHYQVFTGAGTLFPPDQRISVGAIADGSSNTILIVVAEQAVPWAKPDDVPFDPSRPIRPLLSTYHRGAYLVLLADGSVRSLSRDVSEKTLKMAINPNDGEAMGPDW
jgi:hypothetical protein